MSLGYADFLRNQFIAWAHARGVVGFLIVVALFAMLVAIAAWLVRSFAPRASGSGIPDVEAALAQRLRPPRALRLIPVKFAGGVLATSGLAIGGYFVFRQEPTYDGPTGNLSPGIVQASTPIRMR